MSEREEASVDWSGCSLVEVNPRKVSGVPILKGTRLQADSIVENYLSGSPVKEIAANFNIDQALVTKLIEFAEPQSASLTEVRRSKMYFAAVCYLNEWIGFDREAMQALSGGLVDKARALEALCYVATHYSVARGFRKSDGVERFEDVWGLLKDLSRPKDGEKAIELVDDVVERLRVAYGKNLLSATTKFLWMRFQWPVIIYDSLAWDWVSHRGDGLELKTYGDFCRVWRKRFEEHKDLIAGACCELPTTAKFYRPNRIPAEEMTRALASEWFAERVFDNFICDNN